MEVYPQSGSVHRKLLQPRREAAVWTKACRSKRVRGGLLAQQAGAFWVWNSGESRKFFLGMGKNPRCGVMGWCWNLYLLYLLLDVYKRSHVCQPLSNYLHSNAHPNITSYFTAWHVRNGAGIYVEGEKYPTSFSASVNHLASEASSSFPSQWFLLFLLHLFNVCPSSTPCSPPHHAFSCQIRQ